MLFAADHEDGKVTLSLRSISCVDDENFKALAKRDNSVVLYSVAHTAEKLHEV